MSDHRTSKVPVARVLSERYSPITGVPLRVGELWPPRLTIHNVVTKGTQPEILVTPTAWFRHFLRKPLDVRIQLDGDVVDPRDWPAPGIAIAPIDGTVPPVGDASERGAGGTGFHPLPLTVRWTQAFVDWIQDVEYARAPVIVVLSDGETERHFRWYLYLTPHAAEVPRHSSQFDDHPHFRWVDPQEAPLSQDDVARSWIEVPAPLSSPHLPPACWVQTSRELPAADGPQSVRLVQVFPMEPAIRKGLEAVGWNGAMGGHDPRPRVQALPVRSSQTAGHWGAFLYYWDTPAGGHARPVRQNRMTVLEEPTDCEWPEVIAAEERSLQLWDLVGRTEQGCEVKVNLRVGLPDTAEGVRLIDGEIRLGPDVVGRWEGPPIELSAGQSRSITCVVELHKLREASDGRLKLTMAFSGRPTRGVVRGEHSFRTSNGPWARLQRTRAEGGQVRAPWLCIDMGTEGTCASVAFLDGYAPRVVSVRFDQGPIYPTRVYLSPDLSGAWSLTDEPRADSLYTAMVKMGLRYGDGAHPGCPDHVAATEVARFFLKRFLLEVRERMAWFPLEDADVLVSFPPRLASIPTFVSSLRDTFQSVLEEVVWTGSETHDLRFREEGFLVAVPTLYKDLEVSPLPPNGSRFYWVMDFGGGTTDVCGFLCTADEWGEEQTVSHLSYPQRLPHHLAGNDVTRAFYAVLLRQLVGSGVVAGPRDDVGDPDHAHRFPFPPTPFPSVRSTPTALANQNCLRELADALKCTSPTEHPGMTLRSLARTISSTTIRTVDEVATTLVALLSGDAAELGQRTVAELHAQVLDPRSAQRILEAPGDRPSNTPVAVRTGEKANVRCIYCNTIHTLPVWALTANRAFRFRCRGCGKAQRAHIIDSAVPDAADEQGPTILDYRDARVQKTDETPVDSDELYVEQDGRTYVVRDWDTLRRWIGQRRVGPDDLFSEGGVSWVPLGERSELQQLFADSQGISIPDKVPASVPPVAATPGPVEPMEIIPIEEPGLERDIELFLQACGEALKRAVRELPQGEDTEVVVLVAGRASQFGPIARMVRDKMAGRVVHLTNEWVRHAYGHAGQIDPLADLKTLTANGAGLFAVLHSHRETSHLVLSFDTAVMDSAVFLLPAANMRPWLVSERLDLRTGAVVPLATDLDRDHLADESAASAEEPRPKTLPVDTPLAGDLALVVEGLAEDRVWEPYVSIAEGTARRHQGKRPRVTRDTRLRTEERRFVLGPLSDGRELEFRRLLPHLELLGGDGEETDRE